MELSDPVVAYRSERVVLSFLDFAIVAVELLLGLRVILRFLGANPATGFVSWLYSITEQLLSPFAAAFPAAVYDGMYVVEFSAISAMIIYACIGWFIMKIFMFFVSFVARPKRRVFIT
ncbi:hypothetical protein A3D71_02755 [Candidatus Kaiserbacteria bacterium RIFCSPHIGHO2_02_FULL_55_20]|uniref:YggT family protein n=1 Tax=Candidatus Kaiserbacteria bacterium RIFCSPHIGHO2_02_FULL_55_20 TaxID=1798497 RepID=A0A1F6DYM9_9BACT|nr:MAG: hypothetical protein A2680_00095 [Candidatus Kaiserbacteria bacterium RIFCSPHIGHO2_01_FULL_55_37]OGG66554.1 MAG: hypothetical protein A3D71_02755 [Candidatus Kaiserbacteria bacterium RIFCSPHIGHO2_02_FULL_55_20]